MNETIKTILQRKSIRSFSKTPVDEEKIKMIVECAKAAPSGKNRQTRKYTVITSTEKIQKLAEAIAGELNLTDYRIYDCTVLIIVSTPKESEWGELDTACSIENIYLAAHALELGAVWINQLRGIYDKPAIRQILTEFKIPENHAVWGTVALGIPSENPMPKERIEQVEYIR